MMSRREIEQIIDQQLDQIAQEIANGNPEVKWVPAEVKRGLGNFVRVRPDLLNVEIQVEQHYKRWEKARSELTRNREEGQLELGYDYSPLAVILYDKQERGFMKDMTFKDSIKRSRWLDQKLKDTADGIHAQKSYLTERQLVWDQNKHKNLDQLERDAFGWQPPGQ